MMGNQLSRDGNYSSPRSAMFIVVPLPTENRGLSPICHSRRCYVARHTVPGRRFRRIYHPRACAHRTGKGVGSAFLETLGTPMETGRVTCQLTTPCSRRFEVRG